jgi:hypothetical protein
MSSELGKCPHTLWDDLDADALTVFESPPKPIAAVDPELPKNSIRDVARVPDTVLSASM